MKIFIDCLKTTYFKFRLANGTFDQYSYRFWSWGQDIQTHDIKDKTSDTSESCKFNLQAVTLDRIANWITPSKRFWYNHLVTLFINSLLCLTYQYILDCAFGHFWIVFFVFADPTKSDFSEYKVGYQLYTKNETYLFGDLTSTIGH